MSSSDEEELTTEQVILGLVQEAEKYMTALDGEDVPEAGSFPDWFCGHRNAKLCWNYHFDKSERKVVLSGNDEAKKIFLEKGLDAVKQLRRKLLAGIKTNVAHIVSLAPQKACMLFKLYLSLVQHVSQKKYVRKSLEALSDTSVVAAAQITAPLTGEDVHHNMFTSGDLSEQNFTRFEFPHDLELPSSYDSVVDELDTFQQFLISAQPRAKEELTQAVFSLFIEDFLRVFNENEGTEGGARCAVAHVTGMTPVNVPVAVAENYMLQNEELGDLKDKKGGGVYNGSGDWHTELSLQSDLVIYPLSTPQTGLPGAVQQRLFQMCHVNIEMKRLRLLINKMNKKQLTQVSAESYARKSLLTNPKILFSLLTDLCGFYAVCHFVTADERPDEYFISRQVHDPSRAVATIWWLLKESREDAIDLNRLREWLVARTSMSDSNDSALDEDEKKPSAKDGGGPKDCKSGEGGDGPPPKQPKRSHSGEAGTFALSMDQLFGSDSTSDGSSSDNGPDWEFFYAQQMQRQTAQAFHFLGGPLALPAD